MTQITLSSTKSTNSKINTFWVQSKQIQRQFSKILITSTSFLAMFGILVGGLNILKVSAANLDAQVVVTTGESPFSSGTCTLGNAAPNTPGEDYCGSDLIIRTNDNFNFEVSVSSNAGESKNSVINMTLPPATSGYFVGQPLAKFSSLPIFCGSGSTLTSNNTLIQCKIGDIASSTTRVYNFSAKVSAYANNGNSIQPAASVTSTTSPTFTPIIPASIVSAGVNYDLCAGGCDSNIGATNVKVGYDNNDILGYYFTQSFGIINKFADINASSAKAGVGAELPATPITYEIAMGGVTNYKHVTWTNTYTGSNNCSASGGSGVTITCNQSAIGQPASITVNTNPGMNFLAKESKYVTTSYFVPMTEFLIGVPKNVQITASNFDPNSTTGISNYGSGIESTTNNTASRDVTNGGTSVFAGNCIWIGGLLFDNCQNNRYTTTGSTVSTELQYTNNGTTTINNVIMCGVSNPVYSNITGAYRSSVRNEIASDSNLPFVIEYGTGTSANCDNSDSPTGWTTSVTSLGNTASKVRIKVASIRPGSSAHASFDVFNKESTVGNTIELKDYFRSDEVNNGNWNSYGWPSRNQSSVLYKVIPAMVSIQKTSQGNNLQQNQLLSSGLVNFQLDPLFRTTDTTPVSGNVTVTDNLPVGLDYVYGSANIEPNTITNNADGSKTIVWNFVNKTPLVCTQNISTCLSASNYEPTVLPRITFDARVGFYNGNNSTVTNNATISSNIDTTNYTFTDGNYNASRTKSSNNQILVTNTYGYGIDQVTTNPEINGTEKIKFSVRYANLAASPIANATIIDPLPYNNDGRSPSTQFSGTTVLDTVTGTNGETFMYTKAAYGTINKNPNHPSNLSGGSTIWCSSLTGGTCPSNNSEVTGIKIVTGTITTNSGLRTVNINLNQTGSQAGNVWTNNMGSQATIGLLTLSADVSVRFGVVSTLTNNRSPSTAQASDIINNAGVASPTQDNTLSNNSVSVTDQLCYRADLAVTLASVSTVDVGNTINYTSTITNNGPSKVTVAEFVFDYNDLKIHNGSNFTPSQGTASTPLFAGYGASSRVSFDISGLSLAPTQSMTVTFEFLVRGSATGTITPLLTIRPIGPSLADSVCTMQDPTTANNEQRAFLTNINQLADLAINKTSDGTGGFFQGSDSSNNQVGMLRNGANVLYTLSIVNNGPSAAGDPITVTDTYNAAQLQYSSASGILNPAWACTNVVTGGTNGKVTCLLLTPMPNAANETITVNFVVK